MIDYGYGVDLRRLAEQDAGRIFDWRNNPDVWHWCRQYGPLHWQNHKDWLSWQAKDSKTEMFAILARSPGDPVGGPEEFHFLAGVCGLTDVDKVNGRAEFSLYIDPNQHNKGYGKAALLTLFRWGFDSLRLNRIWGESFDGNKAINLFTKLGMEKEGVRRDFYFRDGDFINAHLFSISAATFNDLHGSHAKRGKPDLKPVA